MMTRQNGSLRRQVLLLGVAVIGLAVAGCTSEHSDIPKAETKVVEAYGQTLDADASPTQVAYVLLRATADDVHAAQAFEHDRQEKALNLTFSLAAYDEIEKRIIELKEKTGKGDGLGEDRDAVLYDIVYKWAPIVAHYVNSFDTDYEAARKKMTVNLLNDGEMARVLYPVAHDPDATDPEQRQEETLEITMVREPGPEGHRFWRVVRLDYLGNRATPADRPATAPAE